MATNSRCHGNVPLTVPVAESEGFKYTPGKGEHEPDQSSSLCAVFYCRTRKRLLPPNPTFYIKAHNHHVLSLRFEISYAWRLATFVFWSGFVSRKALLFYETSYFASGETILHGDCMKIARKNLLEFSRGRNLIFIFWFVFRKIAIPLIDYNIYLNNFKFKNFWCYLSVRLTYNKITTEY